MTQRYPDMTESLHIDPTHIDMALAERFPGVAFYWRDESNATQPFERVLHNQATGEALAALTLCPHSHNWHINWEPRAPRHSVHDPDRRPGFRAPATLDELGLAQQTETSLLGIQVKLLRNHSGIAFCYQADRAMIARMLSDAATNQPFEFVVVYPRLELLDMLAHLIRLSRELR